MYFRVVRTTLMGLLRWPDLMVFGLLAFALSAASEALFNPFWQNYLASALSFDGGPPVLAGLLGTFAQQALLSFGGVVIVVACSRVVLARLRGYTMSVLDGLRLGPFAGALVTYAALYTVVMTVFSFAFLLMLAANPELLAGLDPDRVGIDREHLLASLNGCMLLVVAVPLLFGWLAANMLVPPVVAYEGKGGWNALARSALLVRETVGVLIGLVATAAAIGCGLSLLVTTLTMDRFQTLLVAPDSAAALGALPQYPPLMQAILSALLFVVGSIFASAWYLVATEDEFLPSVDFTRAR